MHRLKEIDMAKRILIMSILLAASLCYAGQEEVGQLKIICKNKRGGYFLSVRRMCFQNDRR